MNCDKCGGETQIKVITGKKDGKKYRLFECLGTCQNNQGYAYTFFPPRQETKSQPQRAPQAEQAPKPEAVKLLKSIDVSLKNILQILQIKTGSIAMQDEELLPDEDIEF